MLNERENTKPARKKLSMPVEVVRDQLRRCETTQKIAKDLGMELEEYIEQVLFYATHPEAEPELKVLPEEELEELTGKDAAETEAEIRNWLTMVEEGKLTIGQAAKLIDDRFASVSEDEEWALRSHTGLEIVRAAPSVEVAKGDIVVDGSAAGSVLKNQLVLQRMRTLNQPRKAANDKIAGRSTAR